MTITLAYSGASAPSAHRLAELSADIELVRDSATAVDINWGRSAANAVLNRHTENVTNKRVMRELFHAASVPMPRFYPDTAAVVFPAVGRPDKHTRGKGFWLVRNMSELQDARRGKTYRNGTRKVGATHFMEYVNRERAPYEFRVHVFRGKVIRVSRKDFEAADGRHYVTVSAGGMDIGHVRNAAKSAIAAVGLDFGAVDVLASDSQAWVLEANSAPGLGGSMPELYVRVFNEWKRGER